MSSPSDRQARAALSATFEQAASPGDQPAKRPAPFSLRLSAEERAWLDRKAGRRSLSEYIKSRVFGEDERPRRVHARTPKPDQKQIAELLAALGQSRLSQNMNQLAKAANMGTLDILAELSTELHLACREIREMRSMLISALGLKPVERS